VRRLWRPSALPGAHSCNRLPALRPGAGVTTISATPRSSRLR